MEINGIDLPPGDNAMRLKWGCVRIEVESPMSFRGGAFDVEQIGAYTYLGGLDAAFRHVSRIGRFCSIAPNVVTGQVQHPTQFLSAHPLFQGRNKAMWPDDPALKTFHKRDSDAIDASKAGWRKISEDRFGRIEIGSDVWIGEGAVIYRGVKIGDGAVIAGRAVVTRDVPPYAVVAGIPARVIKMRFADEVCAQLQALRWWDYGFDALRKVDITKPDDAVKIIADNIAAGATPLQPLRYWVDTRLNVTPVTS